MKIEELEIPMPIDYELLLLDLVRKSNEERSLSGLWFALGDNIIQIVIGDADLRYDNIPGDPFYSFNALGLIQLFGDKRQRFILMPYAFEWSKYHLKNKFERLIVRSFDKGKDIMLAIAFILSLALTALQIYTALQK